MVTFNNHLWSVCEDRTGVHTSDLEVLFHSPVIRNSLVYLNNMFLLGKLECAVGRLVRRLRPVLGAEESSMQKGRIPPSQGGLHPLLSPEP